MFCSILNWKKNLIVLAHGRNHVYFSPETLTYFSSTWQTETLIYAFRSCFYLCLSIFKNTRSNCKPIHNVFCITVWELNHKYYLYLYWAAPPVGCLHSLGLLGPPLLGSSGATSIWHSCLHGTFPSVVFLWHKPAHEVMQKCGQSLGTPETVITETVDLALCFLVFELSPPYAGFWFA